MIERVRVRGVTALLAVVAATALAGCGGIPRNASVEDFCATGKEFSSADTFANGVKAARRLSDVGTPAGIPDGARAGFEIVVKLVTGAKNSADLQHRMDKLSDTDRGHVADLDAYIRKTC